MSITTRTIGLAASATIGIIATALPANASGGAEVQLTLESYDYAKASETLSVSNSQRLLINGASQLSWEMEDHSIKVNSKALDDAPQLLSKKCGKGTSKHIAKLTNNAEIVIMLPGSCLQNEGRLGNIIGGFDWHIKGLEVLKWDKKIKKYRHVFNLKTPSQVRPGDEVVKYVKINGKKYALTKACGNIIGGKVDIHLDNVEQVRYTDDVRFAGDLTVATEAVAQLSFRMVCPNGAEFNVYVNGRSNGSATGKFEYTERTRLSAMDAGSLGLKNNAWAMATGSAYSAAYQKIDASAKCGDGVTLPPPPDAQDITLVNRVKTGDKISLDLSGTLAPGHVGTLFCRALNGGTISAGSRQPITANPWAASIDYVAPGEVPDVLQDALGNVIVPQGHDMVECTVTQDDGQTDVIRTEVGPGKFDIFEMPTDPQ